jgi:hypothetical protein
MRVVIAGGVAAGMSAATRLRRLDETAEIVVLEAGGEVSFANCGLPYHVGGVIEERSALLRDADGLARRFRLDIRTRHTVSAIDRDAKRIDDAADKRRTDRNRHDLAGALDDVAFLDRRGFTEEDDADVVLFEVESQSGDVVRELHELAGHDAVEAVNAGDTVADGDDRADFRDIDAAADSA